MKQSRAFRFLLRLLPRDFRSHYGRDMEEVFREQRSEAASRDEVARVWATTTRDVFSVAAREHLEQFWHDVQFALRDMKRRPGFAAAAVLTLAVGIGMNAVVFSMLYTVLLRPLPYGNPDRLVAVWNQWTGQAAGAFSDPEYLDLAEQSRTMNVAAISTGAVGVATESGTAERTASAEVTPNTLDVLEVAPLLGRSFLADEGRPGAAPVVLISEATWRQRFGASPAAIGSKLIVDATPREIVGVLPRGFELPSDFRTGEAAGVLLPLQLDPAAPRNKRGGHYLRLVARLKDGVSIDAAKAELANLYAALKRDYASEYNFGGFGGYLRPLHDDLLGGSRQTLLVLCAAVGMVLLLACANVANLMMARAEARRREMGIRIALGASRFRIVRQLVTEGLVLSTTGAVAGLALAALSMRLLQHWAENGAVELPRMSEVSINAPVVFFTFLLVLLTPLLFGLLPALPVTRAAVADVRSGGTRIDTAALRPRVRRALMAAQVTIATVLLIASGLLLKSLVRVLQQPSGVRTDHVVTFRLTLPEAQYAGLHEVSSFFTRATEDIATIPGVRSVGASSGLPLMYAGGDWSFDAGGHASTSSKHFGKADWYVVTPGYFEALGIALSQGRLPGAGDTEQSQAVIFLNQTAARALFPNENPIGQRLKLTTTTGDEQPWRTIAGVVDDVRTRGLEAPPRPEMYIPHTQFLHFAKGVQMRTMSFVVRSSADPLPLMPTVRARVAALNPLVPVAQVREMDEVVRMAVADRRMTVDLVSAFGWFAVVLAIVGVYGVMDYTVLQRTREIGVRIAMGATREGVAAMILKDGMRLVMIGVVAGIVLAGIFGHVLGGLLFDVRPFDLTVFAAAVAVVMAIAIAAIYLPARKGSSLDPMAALRVD